MANEPWPHADPTNGSATIPPDIYHHIIPQTTLSIHQLVQFTLPAQHTAKGEPPGPHEIETFFSHAEPTSISHQDLLLRYCWSVHKSEEFLKWMKTYDSTIIICFVPGGCTSLWQPLDVGIQRVMKLSIKRSAHCDIVREVSEQLEAETGHDIQIDTRLGTLRDRSVGWIVDAIREINSPELIQKSFELCRIGNFNCSQASLTSPEALEALRNLAKTNPKLYREITGASEPAIPVTGAEEEPAFSEQLDDPSDIPIAIVREHVLSCGSSIPEGFAADSTGILVRMGSGEEIEAMADIEIEKPEILGRGQRKLKKPARFGGDEAWEAD